MQRKLVPQILFGGLSIISAVGVAWFTTETILLGTGKPPITWYVRNKASWHPWITGLVSLTVGLAAGSAITHFVADEEYHP